MSQQNPPRLHEDVTPNLVPMIDVMFLLLLFFMLGADMAQRERLDLPLPLADQAREDREEDPGPCTTVNLRHLDAPACPAHASGLACRALEHWVAAVRGLDHALSGPGAGSLAPLLAVEAAEFAEPRSAGEPAGGPAGEPAGGPAVEIGPPLSRKRLLLRAERTAPYGCAQAVIEAAGRAGMHRVELAAARPERAGAADGSR